MDSKKWLAFQVSILGCLLMVASGCGTNKFAQELLTEEAAIKLSGETALGEYDLVSTSELKKQIDSKQPMVLIDAMPKVSSFDKGHISGAKNFLFPKDVIDVWNEETMGKQTREEYAAMLGEDKEMLIVVYCGFVKCARSHNAAIFAKEMGYTNVKRYPGGIHAWRGAGYGLVK